MEKNKAKSDAIFLLENYIESLIDDSKELALVSKQVTALTLSLMVKESELRKALEMLKNAGMREQ